MQSIDKLLHPIIEYWCDNICDIIYHLILLLVYELHWDPVYMPMCKNVVGALIGNDLYVCTKQQHNDCICDDIYLSKK